MSASLKLIDETLGKARSTAWVLEVAEPILTAREILRRRVFEEVSRYNANHKEVFQGLVQPTDTERVLNGYKLRAPRRLDWNEQFERAQQAFEKNTFVLLVGDRQVENLDEELMLSSETEVTFLKLVPLVGG
jgi:chromosome condensin MukBEF ATPase and DNA-binding subunit MukB